MKINNKNTNILGLHMIFFQDSFAKKRIMKKENWLFGIIIISTSVNAQTGGISASKLATINALPVPERKIEFEPSLSTSYCTGYFNETGKIMNYYNEDDSINIESEISIRITYGLTESMEVGLSVPIGADYISAGVKYKFFEAKRLAIAALAGINSSFHSKLPKSNIKYEESTLIATGFAITWLLNNKFSVDMDSQCQFTLKKTSDQHRYDGFLDIDAGYYVFPWLQPVLGVNYGRSEFSLCNSDITMIVLNTGFTFEPAEQFLMVINSPLILGGKNTDRNFGFGFALTITLE